jgi:hypothetical protein
VWVLVVEDEKRLAAGLKKGLRAEGFAADVALTGPDRARRSVVMSGSSPSEGDPEGGHGPCRVAAVVPQRGGKVDRLTGPAWWSACGWGSGMPAPSGQIPPPWATLV